MNIRRVLAGVSFSILFTFSFVSNATVIIVDNTDAGFTSTGFNPSVATCCVGAAIGTNYMASSVGSTGATATWDATGDTAWIAGLWKVEMNWTSYFNRAENALVTIGPSIASMFVNQKLNGGTWVDLGDYNFSASDGFVTIDDSNSLPREYVIADAVRFSLIRASSVNIPNPATWTLILLAGVAAFRMRRKS